MVKAAFQHWFLAHPAAVGQTYGAHLRAALAISARLLMAGVACAVHAVIPSLFTTTASRAVAQLQLDFTRRQTHRVARIISLPISQR